MFLLFLEGGHTCILSTCGVSFMPSASRKGLGTGVALRALEPVEGVSLARRNRASGAARPPARGLREACAARRIDPFARGLALSLCREGPPWPDLARARAARAGPAPSALVDSDYKKYIDTLRTLCYKHQTGQDRTGIPRGAARQGAMRTKPERFQFNLRLKSRFFYFFRPQPLKSPNSDE